MCCTGLPGHGKQDFKHLKLQGSGLRIRGAESCLPGSDQKCRCQGSRGFVVEIRARAHLLHGQALPRAPPCAATCAQAASSPGCGGGTAALLAAQPAHPAARATAGHAEQVQRGELVQMLLCTPHSASAGALCCRGSCAGEEAWQRWGRHSRGCCSSRWPAHQVSWGAHQMQARRPWASVTHTLCSAHAPASISAGLQA